MPKIVYNQCGFCGMETSAEHSESVCAGYLFSRYHDLLERVRGWVQDPAVFLRDNVKEKAFQDKVLPYVRNHAGLTILTEPETDQRYQRAAVLRRATESMARIADDALTHNGNLKDALTRLRLVGQEALFGDPGKPTPTQIQEGKDVLA